MMDETSPLLSNGHCDGFSVTVKHNKVDKDSTLPPSCDDESSDEMKGLTSVFVKCRTYWYRWYICLVFSMLGFLQGAIWNTWSPINDSARVAFGFTRFDIELLTNWGPIPFIICMPLFMWLLDTKGLRISCVFTAFIIAFGTALRCFPLDVGILKYFIHLGQFLNGIGGCVIMAAPPLLSNIWFPPNERITATGISTLFNYMGTGGAYIVAEFVSDPSNSSHNDSCLHVHHANINDSCHEVIAIRQEISNVLYVECGLAVLVFTAMFLFFPKHPPLPPSVSASLDRISLKEGLKSVRYNKQYLIIAFVTALILGTWGSWTGVMPLILGPLHVSQKEAGNIGFVMTVVGCFAGMLVGWFTDRLKGKMKRMIVILYIIALIMFVYFVILANNWLKFTPFLPQEGEIWTVCIVLGIVMNASVPLGMEMGADAAYPVCEGTSTSILVWLFNVFSFSFLLALGFAPDPTFANYILLGCTAVALPIMIFFTKEQNRRLQLDAKRQSFQNAPSACQSYSSIGAIERW